MALPNILALVVLSPQVKRVLNHYDESKRSGQLAWPDLDQIKRKQPEPVKTKPGKVVGS